MSGNANDQYIKGLFMKYIESEMMKVDWKPSTITVVPEVWSGLHSGWYSLHSLPSDSDSAKPAKSDQQTGEN